MTCRLRLLALLALGAGGLPGGGPAAPSGLAAQAAGLPVRNAGVGTGIGLAADVGFPNAAAGKGIAFGATGALGLGPLGVTATVSHWNPKGADALNAVGGTGNLKIFGGPLIPISVTLQGGLGYHSQSTTDGGTLTTLHPTLGLGLALTIPNPAFSIKPWLAPRLDVTRTRETGGSVAGSATSTDEHFGISGGVDLGFLSGLSFRVMYDRVMAGNSVHPSVLSLGLGFRVGT